jgi:hypothetical protein
MKRGGLLIFGCMLFGPLGLSAQSVECPEWVTPPGGSNREDRAPHRCNLQIQPDISGHLTSLPAPRFQRQGGVRVTVFILDDGSVDPEFTRPLTSSGDWDFADRFLQSLRRIRLSEAELGGVATRFGFELVVETEMRSDSIPEELRWEYRKGASRDTILGRWFPTLPEPPYSSEGRAAVLGRVTEQLIAMRIVTPERRWDYCVLVPDGDSASVEAVRGRIRRTGHWPSQQAEDCHLEVRSRRLILSNPVRTGQGRTIVTASGDHLESWPPGFDGRFFPSWTAYCALLDRGSDVVDCSISPVYTGVSDLDRFRHPEPVRSGRSPTWPVQLQLFVHGADLYLTDTIQGKAEQIPRAEELPVYDRGSNRCTASRPAGAASQWKPDGQRLIRIELNPPSEYREVAANFVSVYQRDPAQPRLQAVCGETIDQPFAATVLKGIGPPFRGSVDLCLDLNCEQYLEVPLHDPLPPVLHFAFADLRPGTRDTRGFLMFKLVTDLPMKGLIPILVLGSGEDLVVTALGEYEDGSYRMAVNITSGFQTDSEVRLYLIRR